MRHSPSLSDESNESDHAPVSEWIVHAALLPPLDWVKGIIPKYIAFWVRNLRHSASEPRAFASALLHMLPRRAVVAASASRLRSAPDALALARSVTVLC